MKVINLSKMVSKEYLEELMRHDIKSLQDIAHTQSKVYNIRIASPFLLTQTKVRESLGVGYKVLSVETERDLPEVEITNIEQAYDSVVRTGYRALARANHPDLGGDAEKMVLINRAKKELLELLDSLKA